MTSKGNKTLGNELISSLDPHLKIEGIPNKARFTGLYVFLLRPDDPREPPVPAQGSTTLRHCFSLKSGRESKAAKKIRRLLADIMRIQTMSKLRGEDPSPPFPIAPQVLP